MVRLAPWTVTVPVKLALLDIVWPLIRPEVRVPVIVELPVILAPPALTVKPPAVIVAPPLVTVRPVPKLPVVATATEPVKLALDEIVWPLIRPEVMVPVIVELPVMLAPPALTVRPPAVIVAPPLVTVNPVPKLPVVATARLPVKLAAEEIVWPLMLPLVMVPVPALILALLVTTPRWHSADR